MYQLINGWTKEKMKAQIRAKNNGKRSMLPQDVPHSGNGCVYETSDGNHCFAGCFIPEGHIGMHLIGGASFLVAKYQDLGAILPLSGREMQELQNVHDTWQQVPGGISLHEAADQWIDTNVTEAPCTP
jgi:hypothetical protein